MNKTTRDEITKADKTFVKNHIELFFAFMEDKITYDEYRNCFQQEVDEYINHLTNLTEGSQEQDKETGQKSVFLIQEHYDNGEICEENYKDTRVIHVCSTLEKAREYIREIKTSYYSYYSRMGGNSWKRTEGENKYGFPYVQFKEDSDEVDNKFYYGETYSYFVIEKFIDKDFWDEDN